MTRTHVLLDGLFDVDLGRDLSARWAAAGFDNAVDVAGQCAWLAPRADVNANADADADADTNADASIEALGEPDVARAAAIARAFGLEIRDRAGSTFTAENSLDALRAQLVYEYKSRFATALMFGLPALALRHLGPILAGGPSGDARAMAYPWLLELLLAGWVCIAAGWPVLWQGVLSLIHLRATGDLLTSAVVVAALAPSALGVLSRPLGAQPWFTAPGRGPGPLFHAAVLAVILATLQRWLLHRNAARIRGRAMMMLPGYSRLVLAWLMLAVVVTAFTGWHNGVAVAMLLPPTIALGAVNPWSPGWSTVLPVLGFTAFFLLAPAALQLNVAPVRIETAAAFALIMTLSFALGWSRMNVVAVSR